MFAEITQTVKDSLYESASYDFDFDEMERDNMAMEVFLFLWEDSCRMVAHMEGRSIPEHFGMDDIECMASDRQVSIHTILLAVQYYELGELDWD